MAAAMDRFAALVAKLDPQHWDQPTPCVGWSVFDVVDHVVAGDRLTAITLDGASVEVASGAANGLDTENPHLEEQVADAAAVALQAFEGSLDRIIDHRVGPVPARRVLGFRIIDQLGHTWDVATATGVPVVLDSDALAVGVDIAVAERATLERSPNFATLPESEPSGVPLAVFLRSIGRVG